MTDFFTVQLLAIKLNIVNLLRALHNSVPKIAHHFRIHIELFLYHAFNSKVGIGLFLCDD